MGKGEKTTIKQVGDTTGIELLWHGNSIYCCKFFRKLNYRLYTKGKLGILMATSKHLNLLINSCHKFYSACRHETNFIGSQELHKQVLMRPKLSWKTWNTRQFQAINNRKKDRSKDSPGRKTPLETICWIGSPVGSSLLELSPLLSDRYIFLEVKNVIDV